MKREERGKKGEILSIFDEKTYEKHTKNRLKTGKYFGLMNDFLVLCFVSEELSRFEVESEQNILFDPPPGSNAFLIARHLPSKTGM